MAFVPTQWVLPVQEIIALGDDNLTSWTQVAKTGSFVSENYGKFEITPAMLAEMVTNFEAIPRAHVDYDHLSTQEIVAPEQSKAAGWFTKLETRVGGTQLWGLVEWTKRAAELIKNREYRFISPTFKKIAKSKETGNPIGARLICAAITNTPFLDGMAPVTLAEVSMDERQRRIADAFNAKFNSGMQPVAHIVEFFDSHVVARKFETGQLFKVDYKLDDDLAVEFGESAEVVQTYTPVGETTMAAEPNQEMIALRDSVTQLRETVTQQNTQIADLTNMVRTAETARQAAETRLAETSASQLVEGLIRSGKLLKKQETWARAYALKDPDGFKTFSEQLTPVRETNTERGSGVITDSQTNDATATDAFNTAIMAHKNEFKCSYQEAFNAVSLRDPGLFKRYRDEMNGTVQ